MRLAVLGPVVCVAADGTPIVPSRRDRALLAALAIDRNRVWLVEELVDAVWGDAAPATAARLIRNRVSALRTRLGAAFVETVAGGYRLGGAVTVDADELLAVSAAGTSIPTDARSWRGRPYVDLDVWEPAAAAAARLDAARSALDEAEVTADLTAGRFDRAVASAEALVLTDVYRERRWELLVHALYLSGRQRDALEAGQRARRTLLDVGLEPGPGLTSLERRILERDPDLQPPKWSPPAPWPAATLVGRVDELARARDALARHRLVTIVGLGGVGKTRLATELALERRGGAVAFADLSSASHDDDVAPVVARALDSLRAWAPGARALVVLDNAEHVAGGAAAVAQCIVDGGPAGRVLVTSRAPLGVPGELVLALGPLHNDDAVRLFDALAARRHGRDAVAELCAALDGLPLAIELAAAKADAIDPAELAARLRVGTSTVDVLGHGRRAGVVDVIEWSMAALSEGARSLLAACSVFRAPFTLDACAAVRPGGGADVSIPLAELVRHSLVAVRFGAPTRYRLLELVRRPAEVLLDRAADRDRAERAFVTWAAAAVGALELGAARTIIDDVANIAEAHRLTCARGDVDGAVRIAGALVPLANLGRTEPLAWALRTVELPGAGAHPAIADVSGDAAWYLAMAGRFDEARGMADRAVAAAPDSLGAGWAWHARAALDSDDGADARALAIAVQRGDALLELAVRSTMAGRTTDTADGLRNADAADRLAGRVAQPWAAQIAAYTRAMALRSVDPASSIRHLRVAQAIADAQGFHLVSAIARMLLLDARDVDEPALEWDRDALERLISCGLDAFVPPVLVRVAGDLVAAGRVREATAVGDLARRLMAPLAASDVPLLFGPDRPLPDSPTDAVLVDAVDVLRLLDGHRPPVAAAHHAGTV